MNDNRTENFVDNGASMALGLVAAKHGLGMITGNNPSGIKNRNGNTKANITEKATRLVNKTLEAFKSFRSRG